MVSGYLAPLMVGINWIWALLCELWCLPLSQIRHRKSRSCMNPVADIRFILLGSSPRGKGGDGGRHAMILVPWVVTVSWGIK
jgi:hypothetical protein